MLKATENWLAQVDYDLPTAEHMLNTGRYIYVIFMCHLALEKVTKALVIEETRKLPPRSHNLIGLAQRAKLVLKQEHMEFIGKINDVSVVTRYPDDFSKSKRSPTGKPLCHCEKRSDEAISGVDWQRLLRYARNDGAEMAQVNGYFQDCIPVP